MEETLRAKIKVLGIGGGGGNAINNMIVSGLTGVEFIAANTDSQALEGSLAPVKIALGTETTKGLGAGGNPEKGGKAALEDIDKVREACAGADMVFITAGLGGGTGTGGAPVIAKACKDIGALTVAVVTKPFAFEGRVRNRNAEDGLKALSVAVDSLITIPNDRLTSLADRRATLLDMFRKVDEVVFSAVRGIADLITKPGLINVDFADVQSVMSEMGLALMGTGVARGENRAAQAAQAAISSPLLEDISIHGARAALINLAAGPDLGMHEFEEAASIIYKEMHEEADIKIGTTIDPSLEDELRVTVIATGIGSRCAEPVRRGHEAGPAARPQRPPRADTGESLPELDYGALAIPTIVRNAQAEKDGTARQAGDGRSRRKFLQRLTKQAPEEEDLSIPAFIRRQAD